MGLDTTHGCWHGAYSAFMRWREKIAEVAGLPPLRLMEGFYSPLTGESILPTLYHGMRGEREYLQDLDALLPIKWECLKPNALHVLLNHSDCEGEIEWNICAPIADELEALLPNFPKGNAGGHVGDWRDKTQQFIDGLRKAYKAKENVVFR